MKIEIIRVIDEPFYYERGDLKEYITNRKCEIKVNGENYGFYGYPSINDIYAMIKKKKALYFPKCIIKDFSLSDYRELFKIDKSKIIEFISANFSYSY
ncbi:MAG: hypothetical protein K8S16_14255 [Bacteroidales bacterium]|nr:hypothetical protein [Bacteroidales bacterium]